MPNLTPADIARGLHWADTIDTDPVAKDLLASLVVLNAREFLELAARGMQSDAEAQAIRCGTLATVARMQSGWGLRQFAEKVCVLPSRYCNFEHGTEALSPDEWDRVLDAYKKSEPWGIDCPHRDFVLSQAAKVVGLESDLAALRIERDELANLLVELGTVLSELGPPDDIGVSAEDEASYYRAIDKLKSKAIELSKARKGGAK